MKGSGQGKIKSGVDFRLKHMRCTIATLLALCLFLGPPYVPSLGAGPFPWPGVDANTKPLAERIQPPAGYERVRTNDGFARWLRNLPLKPGRPQVLLFSGRPKANQTAQYAVIAMDVGAKDLQQCADAVMRLRAEYFWSAGKPERIQFNFSDGVPARYALWRQGYRPRLRAGAKSRWLKTSAPDPSYSGFRLYLETVFTYAGTYSLGREMKPVPRGDLRIGDVFIQGGFPGHAVIVVDLAEKRGGERVFLLAQSYMPAQDLHVLVNPAGKGPWYPLAFGDTLVTPEWNFTLNDIRRFPEK